MVVYPEGVWYGELQPERPERIDQIVTHHLIGGQPVTSLVQEPLQQMDT
jgi:(2Fe-2S) ferredoxin